VRIIHLSDVHVWRVRVNPLHLINKRAVGVFSLLAGRARRFRLERLSDVVARVAALEADHVLITGDLTTTALPAEFADARAALAPLLTDPARATVIPGNHDRYTTGSVRFRAFEAAFGAFSPNQGGPYPWLRRLDERTAILGLDATRSHISATGRLPAEQLAAAARLVDAESRPPRLIVASHYPVLAPPAYAEELAKKRMKNADEVRGWLETLGPHIYCCGHVHAAWAYQPAAWPEHLTLNSGAPLLADPTGLRPPGFLEITLHEADVSVVHHAWSGGEWREQPIFQSPSFFPAAGLAKLET
jgi:3',5'-cyclic AMP phosphodiesterase CpdA